MVNDRGKVTHRVSRWLDSRRWGWPVCSTYSRGGPFQRARLTDNDEDVTCLKCMDILTRPVAS